MQASNSYYTQDSRPDSMQTKAQQDRYSYLMMFCALMMVRNSRASVAQSLDLVPLSPRVSDLVDELTHGVHLKTDESPTSYIPD